MADLLLHNTPQEELIAAIFPKETSPNSCYIISLHFYSSKGGGSSKILGVFTSKKQAAEAFITRVKTQVEAQNAAYRKHVEEEDYFEEEPCLEYAAQQQMYRFRATNTFEDTYEWYLTRKVLNEMEQLK